MGGEWKGVTLGDVMTLQRGFDLPVKERHPGLYPVIASTGQVGTHIEAKAKGPGVVIGRSGSLGGGQYIRSDYWPLNTTLWVKDFKRNDPRFCYYLLKSMDFSRYNAGSGVPTLNRNHIHPLPVKVPDTGEQRAIAHILGTLDDKIELNRRMNETLEAMARAIFKSWFVDFDPVRAKSEGRDPGLPKDIADLFPDSFDDSELGQIPMEWAVRPFSELINLIGGGTPKTKVTEYWGSDIPWFSVVDTPSDSDVFVIDTEKHVSQLGVDNSSANILRKGTTIISARGTVGKCALVGCPMAMNQSCYGIQGAEGRSDYFTYFTVRHQVADLQRSGHGSVFNTITRDTFRSILLTSPPAQITVAFDAMIDSLMESILTRRKENATLATIRDALLPKLISGELRVPDAEKFLEVM